MDLLGSMKQELLMGDHSSLSSPSSLWSNVDSSSNVVPSRPVVSHLRKDLAQHDLSKTSKDPFKMLSMFYQQQQNAVDLQHASPSPADVSGSFGGSSLSRIRAKKKQRERNLKKKVVTNSSVPDTSVAVNLTMSEPLVTCESEAEAKMTEIVDTTQTCSVQDEIVKEDQGVEDPESDVVKVEPTEVVDFEVSFDNIEDDDDTEDYDDTRSNFSDDLNQEELKTIKEVEKKPKRKYTKKAKTKDGEKPKKPRKVKEDGEPRKVRVPQKRKPRTPEEEEELRNKERPFLCIVCGKTYLSKKNLRYHERSHSDERIYTCDYPGCDKSFKLNAHLKNHKYMHGEVKLFHCSHEGCDKAYKAPDTLRIHEQIHKPGEFACTVAGCDKTFIVKRRLGRHILRAHRDNRHFPCTFDGCDRVCTSRSNLKEHMEAHQVDRDRFTCKICGKILLSENTLKRHVRQVHCAERSFMCNICGKRFKTQSNLKQHFKSHVNRDMKDKRKSTAAADQSVDLSLVETKQVYEDPAYSSTGNSQSPVYSHDGVYWSYI